MTRPAVIFNIFSQEKLMVRTLRATVLTVVMIGCLRVSTLAQSQLGSGSLSGVVTDSTGGVVPDADVTVLNAGTGEVRKTTTGPSGQFTVPVLPIGEHTVHVGKAGFVTSELKGVTVTVGSATTLRVVLAVGSVESVVDVEAKAPMVDATRTAEVSLVDRTEISNLPLNGRRADQFALLAPGISRDGTFGQLSYRGFSGVFNNFTIEGNDDNEAYNATARGNTRVASNVSIDAVQEFQVGQSNFLPEFGRAAGGSINTVIRSGSNERHADGFYYFRNQALNARDPLASSKPDELRQQFGGSVSGPLRKDNAFYFLNYDQQRRSFPLVVEDTNGALTNGAPVLPANATAQQQAQYSADLEAFNAGVKFLRQQFPGGAPGNTLPRHPNQELGLVKVDWLLNTKHTLTASNNVLHSRTDNGVFTSAVTGSVSNSTDAVDTDTLNTRLTTAVTSHQVNELRVQWSRDKQHQIDNHPGPSVSVSSFSFGRNSGADRLAPDERRIQLVDNYSDIVGSHALKFGFDFNRAEDVLDITGGFQGSYSYTNALAFGRDLLNPAGFYTSFRQSFGLAGITFATRDLAGFAQDQWKPRGDLTFNYGIRYDYESLPHPVFPNPAIPETRRLNADRTNFGPRVGLAYDLASNGKTILRAGYGIFYGRTPNGTLDNALRQTGLTDPTQGTQQVTFLPTDPGAPRYPGVLSTIPTGASTSPPFVTRLDTNFRRPRVQEANVGVERQVEDHLSVSASYVYSYGNRLPITYDQNLPQPNFTRTYQLPDGSTFQVPFTAGVTRTASGTPQNVNLSRLNPNFGSISVLRSLGEQWYHGLLVEARRQFADGFQAHLSYTLAKAENLSGVASFAGGAESAFGGGSVEDQFNPRSSRGRAPTDQRHRLVVDGVWNLPFGGNGHSLRDRLLRGFRLSGILVAESGRPYSASISGSSPGFITPDGTQYAGFGSGIYGQGGLSLLPTIPRNSSTGEASWRVDVRLSRDLHFANDLVVELLAEGFNIFNPHIWTQYNNTIYSAATAPATNPVSTPVSLTPTTNFGTPSADNGFPDGTNARRFQLAARFRF
jgi:hypothetical protein